MTRVLPNPIHQSIYFSLVGPMSLGSVSQPRVAGGGTRQAKGGGPGGGESLRGVGALHIQ